METSSIANDKELYDALYKTLVNLNRSDVDAITILSEMKEHDGRDLNRALHNAIVNCTNPDEKEKLTKLNQSLTNVLVIDVTQPDQAQNCKAALSEFIQNAKEISNMMNIDAFSEAALMNAPQGIRRIPDPALVSTSDGYTIQEAFFLNKKNGNKRLLLLLTKLDGATKDLVKKVEEKSATQKDVKIYLSISLFGNNKKQGISIAKTIDILKDMTDKNSPVDEVYDSTQKGNLQDLSNKLQRWNKDCYDVIRAKGNVDLTVLEKSGKALIKTMDVVKAFVTEINNNALNQVKQKKEEREKDKKLPFFQKTDKAITKFTGEDTPTAKAADVVKTTNPSTGVQIKESYEDEFDDEIIQEGLFTTSKNIYNRLCYALDICIPYINDIAVKIEKATISSPEQLKNEYKREVKVKTGIGADTNGDISTYQTTEYGKKTLESFINYLIHYLRIAANNPFTKSLQIKRESFKIPIINKIKKK